MAKQIITQKRLKEVLHYNPETGIFTWLVNRTSGQVKAGSEAGFILNHHAGKKYRSIGVDKRTYPSHRLAWMYVHGIFPADQIDHEDGNGLNNKIDNLKQVNNAQNGKNKKLLSNNTSGTAGVYRVGNRWRAIITVNYSSINLGYFINKIDAIICRKMAEVKYGFHRNHGEERPL